MDVTILKQKNYLIATIQAVLTDEDLINLRERLVTQVGRYRSIGVILDVTGLDVMDSFSVRTLRDMAHMIRLRGAETVIVGIQPEVAFSMVQLGLTLMSCVDFHGDANPYKFQWANAVHAQKRFEAYSPSLAGQILWVTSAYGRPAAKTILHWLGLHKIAKRTLARWGRA